MRTVGLICVFAPLLMLSGPAALTAQCTLEGLWTIRSVDAELREFWPDAERVDFNPAAAVFTRRTGHNCTVLSCPAYRVSGDELTLVYGPGDTLRLHLRFRGCRIADALAPDDRNGTPRFTLFRSPDAQCDFPAADPPCAGGRAGTVTSSPQEPEDPKDPEDPTEGATPPVIPAPDSGPEGGGWASIPGIDPSSPVPSLWQLLFLLLYGFYALAFLVLRLLGRRRHSNYCWLILCVLTGLYSPYALGPLLAFVIHLSLAVSYLLRGFTPLKNTGRLFLYGAFGGTIVAYETYLRLGAELASTGAAHGYFTAVPLLVFLCGLPLFLRVFRDGFALGFTNPTVNFVAVLLLYGFPYWYVYECRTTLYAVFAYLGFG